MTYQPLQKIILFDQGYPVIGWVVAERLRRAVWGNFIKVSRHYQDATEGRGRDVRNHHIQPYSDELWAACEAWIARGVEQQETLDQLAKGKIMPKLRQMELAL
jgi:hypothetical protein